jgi:integrase
VKTPWFRAQTRSWYVDWGGQQVNLGKDPRYVDEPPKQKPKEPPKEIVEAYERLLKDGKAQERTFDEAKDQYLKHLKASDSHVKAVRLHLNWFSAFVPEDERRRVGALRMDELKKHMLTGYLQTKPKWKPNTRRYAITRILACLNHCAAEQYIPSNPLKGYKRPRVERRQEVVTQEEQEKLEAAASPSFRAFMVGLRLLGARPGELRNLLIEDCDLEQGVIKVKNKTRDQTGDQTRPIFLATEAIALIRGLIGSRTTGHVFLTPRGIPWKMDHLEQTMRRLRDDLGLGKHVSLYGFRHRYISDSINVHNINPALVAIQAGHSDLKMLLKHYLHSDVKTMREAAEKAAKKS